jgi:hypothetical protein
MAYCSRQMYSWIIWSYPFGTVVEHVSGVPNQEMLSLIKECHGCKLSNYIEWLVHKTCMLHQARKVSGHLNMCVRGIDFVSTILLWYFFY